MVLKPRLKLYFLAMASSAVFTFTVCITLYHDGFRIIEQHFFWDAPEVFKRFFKAFYPVFLTISLTKVNEGRSAIVKHSNEGFYTYAATFYQDLNSLFCLLKRIDTAIQVDDQTSNAIHKNVWPQSYENLRYNNTNIRGYIGSKLQEYHQFIAELASMEGDNMAARLPPLYKPDRSGSKRAQSVWKKYSKR